MEFLVLSPLAWLEVEALNITHPTHKLSPVKTTDGRLVVNADILTDIHDNWFLWADVLRALPKVTLTSADFPVFKLPTKRPSLWTKIKSFLTKKKVRP